MEILDLAPGNIVISGRILGHDEFAVVGIGKSSARSSNCTPNLVNDLEFYYIGKKP
jgi:hypothetical protein